MLIIIIGAPQSGKNTLAQHLVAAHRFKRVRITPAERDASSGSTSDDALRFSTSSAFLDHATSMFQADFVTTDVQSAKKLDEFAKRPFVAIVALEAPTRIRFSRALSSAKARGHPRPTLEQFVQDDDDAIYGTPFQAEADVFFTSAVPSTPQKTLSPYTNSPPSPSPSPARSPVLALSSLEITTRSHSDPLVSLLPLAHLTLSNPHSTLEPFLASLSLSSLAELLRPPWDAYFMRLATLASLRSNCMKRRVGAVLVRERRVVSTGYNGTPRGVRNCNEGGCARCNNATNSVGVGLNECLCLHAEENALLEAGRERVSGGGMPGAVLYCNTCPCLRCTVKIVQCGVTEVVYSLSYAMDLDSRRIMEEAGVTLRQIKLPSL